MRHSVRANRHPVQVISFPSPSGSARDTRLRKRCWLSALAVLFVIIMAVGIVFVAHKAYHDMGGQGFLKIRRGLLNLVEEDVPEIYLPLRKVKRGTDEESLLVYGVGHIKRSPDNVPFYACGDQQHNCEAFGQPVSMTVVCRGLSNRNIGNLLPSKNGLLSYQCRRDTIKNLLLQFDFGIRELHRISGQPPEMYHWHYAMLRNNGGWVLPKLNNVLSKRLCPIVGSIDHQCHRSSNWYSSYFRRFASPIDHYSYGTTSRDRYHFERRGNSTERGRQEGFNHRNFVPAILIGLHFSLYRGCDGVPLIPGA